MAELWQEAWAGACAVTAVSGGANAAYFTATSTRASAASRRLGAQVLALVNAGAALQAGNHLAGAAWGGGNGWPGPAALLSQGLVAAGMVATSVVVARRLAASGRWG